MLRRLLFSALWCALPLSAAAAPPSFRHEVMPLLSRMGCNMGACHGAGAGKGNLKLSLRGESPEGDHAVLTQNLHSKRLNVDSPEASFLLKKPVGQTEHEGGTRFSPDSEEYRTLRDWIAAGAPFDPPGSPVLTKLTVSPETGVYQAPERQVPLKVTAEFSDGAVRDVTRMAVYEASNLLPEVSRDGVVTAKKMGETTVIARFEHLQTPARLAFIPARPDYVWSAPPERNFIDHLVDAKLQLVRSLPSPVADDRVFARRVFLDLIGLPPTPEEVERFLADPSPDKRDRLIDSLTDRPEFASFWALKWADLLRVEERILDNTGVTAFHGWIRDRLARDVPLNEFARDILAATGSTYENPPTNFYRAVREPTQRAESVAQVFLGTRLACAKCHNHPFEKWTQDDYYHFAAVFDGIGYDVLRNDRRDENDKLEFVGEQVVFLGAKKELKDPRSKQEPPAGLLGEKELLTGDNHLDQLAAAVTRPDHPLFARVQANRIWSQVMGLGLVEPVDDFRLTNPPSNPALLDALTAAFVENGMRLKPLVRLICKSRTYQLSSEPTPGNAEDSINYARAIVKRLPAEPLLDAIHQALGMTPEFTNYPEAGRAADIPGVALGGRRMKARDDDLFLRQFGKPPRTITCDCERTAESSLAQVFTLTSGPGVSSLISDPANRLTALSAPNKAPAAALRELYLHCLSRPPSAAEEEHLTPMLADPAGRRAALEDLAWSLINSKEFILRR